MNLSKISIYTIILFSLILFSCTVQDEKFVPEKFEIEHTAVKMPLTVKEIIAFEGGYICNFENWEDSTLQIGCLDKNFHLMKRRTMQLNRGLQFLKSIWTAHDTLFAIDATMVKYWRNGRWNFKKKLPLEDRTNYMSYELNVPIYEDAQFIVRACSRGEFGGAVFFKDKKTGKTYSCASNCVNAVHKIDGAYYVSSSLAHGCGFSKVLQIADPRKLYEIKKMRQRCDCGWYDIYSKDPKIDEIKHPVGYDKGYKVLMDTAAILLTGAFESNGHLYHIFSDSNTTYLGYLNRKKVVVLDTIGNHPSWYYGVRDLQHNPNLFIIRNRKFNGVIVREKNKIRLIKFKN